MPNMKKEDAPETPAGGAPADAGPSSAEAFPFIRRELERVAALETSIEEIRKEIRELQVVLRRLDGLEELGSQIQSLQEGQREQEESLVRRFQESRNGFQQLRVQMEELLQKQQGEQKKSSARIEEIGEQTATGLPRIQEELKQIGNRMESLLEEQVNQGQLLALLKGEAERNAVALKGIREQAQELISKFQEQTQRLAEEAERSQTEEARQLNNQGVVLYHRGALEAAAEHFLKATKIQPVYPEAYNNLGLTYSRMDRAEEAVEAFQKAIQLDPKMAETYNNLGFHYHSTLQYDRAVEMFRKALVQNGDFAEAYTNLGNSLYRLREHEKAVKAWKRAVEIDPMNQNALRSLRMFEQAAGGNGDRTSSGKDSPGEGSQKG